MPHVTGVYIAVPAYNRVTTSDTLESLYATGQLLTSEGVPNFCKSLGCADVEDLRNIMITQWYHLHKDMSHLLMVDADMHFSPFMIWDMIKFDKEVTGVFYPRREFPVSVVGKALNDTDTDANIDRGHLEVEGVGGGVLLIKRSAVDKLIAKFPELVDTAMMSPVAGMVRGLQLPHLLRLFKKQEWPDGRRLSEDLSFCWRWREAGGKVWANVHHPIGHTGPFTWRIRYEEYLAGRGKEQAPEAA